MVASIELMDRTAEFCQLWRTSPLASSLAKGGKTGDNDDGEKDKFLHDFANVTVRRRPTSTSTSSSYSVTTTTSSSINSHRGEKEIPTSHGNRGDHHAALIGSSDGKAAADRNDRESFKLVVEAHVIYKSIKEAHRLVEEETAMQFGTGGRHHLPPAGSLATAAAMPSRALFSRHRGNAKSAEAIAAELDSLLRLCLQRIIQLEASNEAENAKHKEARQKSGAEKGWKWLQSLIPSASADQHEQQRSLHETLIFAFLHRQMALANRAFEHYMDSLKKSSLRHPSSPFSAAGASAAAMAFRPAPPKTQPSARRDATSLAASHEYHSNAANNDEAFKTAWKLDEQQLNALKQDNDALLQEFTETRGQLSQTESSISEIAHLQQIMQENLVHQASQIERLYDDAEQAELLVTKGNKYLVSAASHQSGFRKVIIVLIMMAAFVLLFLHYYVD